jgi:diguanylate cyclase (GGDEF)-like protein
MARFTSSIRGRVMIFILTFVVIVVGVAVSGALSLRSVDLKTREIDQQWLTGTAMLAELADRLAEYRIAEGYRALAPNPKMRAQAELLANDHRRAIETLQTEYIRLLGGQIQATDLNSFRAAWKNYTTAHDAWVRMDADGTQDEPARYGGSLDGSYKAADAAVDGLISANNSAAHAQAAAVDALTARSISIAILVSSSAILLAGWLLARTRTQITRPLAAITQALSQLAAGSREVRVPELHRTDEIGEMAKAFEIFRSNALALEKAHEATRAAQQHAHSVSQHDALTGLRNRRVFSLELQTLLKRTRKSTVLYSVLFVGLDHFKQINDLHGHSLGDVVLCEVARRIKDTVGRNGLVARLGGDEFAIVIEGDIEHRKHVDAIGDLANRVLAAVRRPIAVGERTIEVGASIGIAPRPVDNTDAEGLMRFADIAMYRAKRDARGSIRFFERSMNEDLLAQASLEADVKSAVAAGKIQPYYQPLVEIRSNRLTGFEALARWQHAERGFVAPDMFIPLIEQLGLMSEFTSSILRQVCRDAKDWPQDIRVAVNISPSELKDPLLPSRLLAVLAEEGFDPARLEVEITETALISDIDTAKTTLAALKSKGITTSLDDFGTGYSSLYHLRELKFDKVKIDRSFINSMLVNSESEKIVDAILGLAKNLKMSTVAEGIEDPAILLRLAAKGCEFGQGYYFGKAMTARCAGDALIAESRTGQAA